MGVIEPRLFKLIFELYLKFFFQSPDGRPIHSSTHTSTSYKPGIECMIDPPNPEVAEEELRKRKQREEERKKRKAKVGIFVMVSLLYSDSSLSFVLVLLSVTVPPLSLTLFLSPSLSLTPFLSLSWLGIVRRLESNREPGGNRLIFSRFINT